MGKTDQQFIPVCRHDIFKKLPQANPDQYMTILVLRTIIIDYVNKN